MELRQVTVQPQPTKAQPTDALEEGEPQATDSSEPMDPQTSPKPQPRQARARQGAGWAGPGPYVCVSSPYGTLKGGDQTVIHHTGAVVNESSPWKGPSIPKGSYFSSSSPSGQEGGVLVK